MGSTKYDKIKKILSEHEKKYIPCMGYTSDVAMYKREAIRDVSMDILLAIAEQNEDKKLVAVLMEKKTQTKNEDRQP